MRKELKTTHSCFTRRRSSVRARSVPFRINHLGRGFSAPLLIFGAGCHWVPRHTESFRVPHVTTCAARRFGQIDFRSVESFRMSASLPGLNDVSAWSDFSGGNWPWCELESIPLLTLEVRRLCRFQFCAILYNSKFALLAESSGAPGNYPRYFKLEETWT